MIDKKTEPLVRLSEILHTWANVGNNGVKLEAVYHGGARCTTEKALKRFFESLFANAPDKGEPSETEPLIRLVDVPALNWLPTRDGRKLNSRTIQKWAKEGRRGIKLETISAGGARCTTEAALLRFFEKLSGATNEATPAKPPSNRQSIEGHARATAYLERLGI